MATFRTFYYGIFKVYSGTAMIFQKTFTSKKHLKDLMHLYSGKEMLIRFQDEEDERPAKVTAKEVRKRSMHLNELREAELDKK